jgi:hypothetical protein
MLADRADVRLAAAVTDTLLLGSPAALTKHRERQLAVARAMRPTTEEGKHRRSDLLEFLADEALSDGEYALAAMLPLVGSAIVQQAICFFRGDEWRDAMSAFRLMIDEEAAPTMRYGDVSLLPSLGVSTEQVVQAADGCLSAEGLVSSAMVVLPDPAVKGACAFG